MATSKKGAKSILEKMKKEGPVANTMKKLQKWKEHPDFNKIIKTEFDNCVQLMCSEVKLKYSQKMNVLINQMEDTEKKLRTYVDYLKNHTKKQLEDMEDNIELYKYENRMLRQWLNRFMIDNIALPDLDEIDLSFCRFALNIALASDRMKPDKILETKVACILMDMLRSENNLVLGAGLLAIAHVSLHNIVKKDLVTIGVIDPILYHISINENAAVLVQALKALGSIALLAENKPILGAKGCLSEIVSLTQKSDLDFYNDQVAEMALLSMGNMLHSSEANRIVAMECGVIVPVLEHMHFTNCPNVMYHGARVLANLSYHNEYTAARILVDEGDQALLRVLKVCDVTTDHKTIEMVMCAAANMANTEVTQNQLGSSKILKWAIHVVGHSTNPYTVKAATDCIGSLCFKNFANKSRAGDQGALKALISVTLNSGRMELTGNEKTEAERQFSFVKIAAWNAIATLCLQTNNQMRMMDKAYLSKTIKYCKTTEELDVLPSACMALSTFVPDPDSVLRLMEEGRTPAVKKNGGLLAFNRAMDWVFNEFSGNEPPLWIMEAIEILDAQPDNLMRLSVEYKSRPSKQFVEFTTHQQLFFEHIHVIEHDADFKEQFDGHQRIVYRIYN